jgi:choline dehydrogenase-like flavoprotein
MLNYYTPELKVGAYDLCIIGAGPVGIALAIACEELGLSALLLESGYQKLDTFAQSLTTGHKVDPERHQSPEVSICRGLGGTSRWWGGRCVPFDEIDFQSRRCAPEGLWPFSYDEAAKWHPWAAKFFQIGSAEFSAAVAPWTKLSGARFEALERWTPETNCAKIYQERLINSERISVLLGATVTAIEFSDDKKLVKSLTVKSPSGSSKLAQPQVALTCGGLETTRLLLAAQQESPDAFGGKTGALGRNYVGHLSGKIADLIFTDPNSVSLHDFFLSNGAFARRRFTLPPSVQANDNVLNIAFWADNPPFHAAEHRSAALSLVWLALATPGVGRRLLSEGILRSHLGPLPYRRTEHLVNVLKSPISAFQDILRIIRARFLSSPRRPGFLIHNPSGRYALLYQSEQTPHEGSRVTLSNSSDALGLPFLNVELQYKQEDAESVVRAHKLLDASLRESGLGRLEFYDADDEERAARVLRQAADGFHQIGTTRIGTDPSKSVVNSDCQVHGIENLYVVSSSVFPSSSQANPTYLSVALAVRLANHIKSAVLKRTAAPTTADISARVGDDADDE